MVKPFTTKEVSKSILIGVSKGIIYYILLYIVLFGIITYYLIPYIITLTRSNISIEDPARFTGYRVLNWYVLSWFLSLSIISTVLSRHIPYGGALSSFIGIFILYIVFQSFNFGKFTGYIEEYRSSYTLNISPLMYSLFYILVLTTIGGAFISIAREYKKRREKSY
ncbi:MAG: hypothetical protein B6U89_01860 [Desulfurococcales archaeon ex4484_58]|nr:MAG: hypothetical protein B6U89_01860 [Desulfurococcales archaeon ex4484_58]